MYRIADIGLAWDAFDTCLGQSRLEAMQEAFSSIQSGTGGASGLVLAGIAGLAIAIAVAAYYVFKFRSAQVIDNPTWLFHELCRKHELSSGQRQLLALLASAKGLSDPSALFIDAQLWDLDPVKHPKLCTAKYSHRLRVAQHTLFNQTTSPGAHAL